MTEVQHWFTVQEVAEHRRITPDLVYKLFRRHCLPGYKVGKQWRFARDEVDAWVKADKASAESGDTAAAVGRARTA